MKPLNNEAVKFINIFLIKERKLTMRKFLFSAFVMLIGLGAYAQEATPAVNQAPAVKAKKVELTPKQEAQKLVDMLTQDMELDASQKEQILEVALNAVKQRQGLASLKASDPNAYAQKEMDIFIDMSGKIKDIENQ